MGLLRLLTRGSALALAQSQGVAARLEAAHPELRVEVRTIRTRGDRITDVPLSQVGGKGLFVKEIEEALLNDEGDIAVHSLKDMPSELPPGLTIAVVPAREDPRDALVLPAGVPVGTGRDGLPVRDGGRVGSSSLRRRAQLLAWRPDLRVENLRGNLDTRLRKLDAGEYDAIVLAAAGLRRMGWMERISLALPVARFVPAVGQGALAIEAREADVQTGALLAVLEDATTRACVTAERAFLARLEGNCLVPLGALATCRDEQISMLGMLADADGGTVLRREGSCPMGGAAALGEQLAAALLAAGDDRIREGFSSTTTSRDERE
jgi:hydroxymethylbilane synthase